MHSTRPIHTSKIIYGVGLVQEDGKSNGSGLRANPNSLDDRPLIINRDRNINECFSLDGKDGTH